VSFRAEVDGLSSELCEGEAVLLEVAECVEEGVHEVEEVALGETVFGLFLLGDGLREGEVVVVAVAVHHSVDYAQLLV
jgi:hypothetical protein